MACNKLEEIIEFADSQIKKWEKMAEEPSKWDKCFPSQCHARVNEANLFKDKVLSIISRIKDIDKIASVAARLLETGMPLDLIVQRLEIRQRDQDNPNE